MLKKISTLINLSVLAVFIAACGGGGGGGGGEGSAGPAPTAAPTPTTAPIARQGVFLDSPVVNIGYRTETLEGLTDVNGAFDYMEGETVTFFIGDLVFPTVPATGLVTPLTLANSSDPLDPQVINIIRLLQSLDSDGDPANGITIPSGASAAASVIDLDNDIFSFEANADVVLLVANSGSPTTELVPVADALIHFTDELVFEGLIDDTDIDADGIIDVIDVAPNDDSIGIDSDFDGAGDSVDAFPTDPSEQMDADGDGIGDNSDTDITPTPAPTPYTVGGTVTGLTGTLVLQNNGGDDLTLNTEGSFVFDSTLISADSYSVTVLTQPESQTCSVSGGSGVISDADVSSISILCGTRTYTVGGTVTGLTGTLILQNNTEDDLTLNADGSYVFATALENAATYDVDISLLPEGFTCDISNGEGDISTANVSNVDIACTASDIALTNLGVSTESPSVVVMPIHAEDNVTGLSIRGLTASNFLVREDGIEVGVESFVDSRPVGDASYVFNIVVAMDISSSISAADITAAKTALQGYVDNLQANQELSIYTFDDVVTPVQSSTSDQALLTSAVNSISRGGPSTNLYGAIAQGAAAWTNNFSLDAIPNVTYGALIVITDGDDTSALVTKAAAQAAVEGKTAYAVPVGAAGMVGTPLYSNLVDIFGASQVLEADDFSVLTNTLDAVRDNLLAYFDGLYYVYYASPARSGTHTIELSVVGNSNFDADGTVSDTFDATGFRNVVPIMNITGESIVKNGEIITWDVETLWSNDPADYSWGVDDNGTMLSLTPVPSDTSQAALSTVSMLDGVVTVTVIDENWDISLVKTVDIFVDIDYDGISNSSDDDDDGDGVSDARDLFPFDASESLDTDGDGIGNNADADDDGDMINDADETPLGTDPLDFDSDNDTISDGDEVQAGTDPLLADSDSDGISDRLDPYPLDPNLPVFSLELSIIRGQVLREQSDFDNLYGEIEVREAVSGTYQTISLTGAGGSSTLLEGLINQTTYNVLISKQPDDFECKVENPSSIIIRNDATVRISCTTPCNYDYMNCSGTDSDSYCSGVSANGNPITGINWTRSTCSNTCNCTWQ